jgi:peptidoglycan/LPS O-acetylase OafA/YrhL/lysophospholipase L1-like esterase
MATRGDGLDAGRLPHLPALDGLRGVAVAVVLLYHAGFDWMIGGYLGVSTFFTLSGFLITSLLANERERTGRIDLVAFWERRARRILPAALITLLGVAAFGALVADDSQRRFLRGDGLAALGWVVNWWFVLSRREYMDQFASPSPVLHFWSLAIEEQFYVVAPLVVGATFAWSRGSRRAPAIVLAGLGFASAWWLARLATTDATTARLYFGTDTRAAEFLAGAVLALTGARQPMRAGWRHLVDALGVVGLGVNAYCWTHLPQGSMWLYQGGLPAYTLATVAVLAAARLPGGAVRALFSVAPLRWLGRISYGTYLYHFPVFLWLTPDRTGLDGMPLLAIRLGVSLGLAELSYRVVEWPIRARRLPSGPRAWATVPWAFAVVAVALVAVSVRGATFEAPRADQLTVPCEADARRVLLVGDSVVEGIAAGLTRWSRTDGRIAVTASTRRGCGIAHGNYVERDAESRTAMCKAWGASWKATVSQQRPDVVVIYTGGWDILARQIDGWPKARDIGDPLFDDWIRSAFSAAIDTFTADGARVVWLTSMCGRSAVLGPTGVFDPVRIVHLNDAIIRPLANARDDRVALVDLFAAVCPRGRYTNRLGGHDGARPDGLHFSDAGADWLADWLGPRLAREPRRHVAGGVL